MPWWWVPAEDERPGGAIAPRTEHLAGTRDVYVRTIVRVTALQRRWRLVVRDYQQARHTGELKTTLALEERRRTKE